MLVADVLALPPFYSHRAGRSRQPRLARRRAERRTARASPRSEPPRHVHERRHSQPREFMRSTTCGTHRESIGVAPSWLSPAMVAPMAARRCMLVRMNSETPINSEWLITELLDEKPNAKYTW